MIIRDRQFPCVVMWSLGNEAGNGNTFNAMANVTRQFDYEGRLCQYEGMPSVCKYIMRVYVFVLLGH
jgi:beta-galactosidase